MIRWLTFLNLLYPAVSDVRHREFFVWPILAGAGAEDTFVICISGFMAAAAVGLILIARGQRRAALPYMPFFTAFYILNWYFAWKG